MVDSDPATADHRVGCRREAHMPILWGKIAQPLRPAAKFVSVAKIMQSHPHSQASIIPPNIGRTDRRVAYWKESLSVHDGFSPLNRAGILQRAKFGFNISAYLPVFLIVMTFLAKPRMPGST